ncbi:universal stress protein [Bordetella bronchialis]|uniref:universal stress protein n=1 Tax=Bordetella bronchialis TaxID=463025 RepID=UPI003D060319
MYRHILVAVDGSITAERALDHAISLAKSEHAKLLAVYIVEYPSSIYSSAFIDVEPFHESMVNEAQTVLNKVQAKFRDAGVEGDVKMVDAGALSGTIADQLRAAAGDAGVDLVVMGTHGRRGFQRLVLGSVAEAFVRQSNCPVMLVPHREDRAPAPGR